MRPERGVPRRIRGTEDRNHRSPHRACQVHRSGVAGDEQIHRGDECGEFGELQLSGPVAQTVLRQAGRYFLDPSRVNEAAGASNSFILYSIGGFILVFLVIMLW